MVSTLDGARMEFVSTFILSSVSRNVSNTACVYKCEFANLEDVYTGIVERFIIVPFNFIYEISISFRILINCTIKKN